MLETELVARKFEDIMGLMTNLAVNEAAKPLFDPNFVEVISLVGVTGALLRDLESEYEHLKLKATSIYSR